MLNAETGHVEIDMKSSGIDALAVAGHKGMLGVQGSGALLFSERMNPAPVLFGGTGSESYNLNMPDFYPDALESLSDSSEATISDCIFSILKATIPQGLGLE